MKTVMLRVLWGSLLITLLVGSSIFIHAQCPQIIWSDEFTGSSLDLNKWSYQIGDGCPEGICGWGNNELQYYQEANVTVSNGQLHITAKKERVRSKAYTSGRIRTINKGDWTYGRFEARIKLPSGKGLWPAFWMLPTDGVYGGWPQSGEIDIMEFVAADASHVLGTIHYGDPYPNNQHQGGNFTLHTGVFPDAFHDFAIEWEAGTIRWFIDDILYLTKTATDVAPYNWPFDQRFHFLLNVAVGGTLGGPVDDSIFPKVMDVEFVRVYNGFKPYITGDRVVSNQENGVSYQAGNVSGVSINWTVPTGATIVSGQGTSNIVVNFGSTSGNVTASFNTSCGVQQLVIPVLVEPPFSKEFSFENFDEPATATLGTYTGTLTEVPNPASGGVNTSALVGKYIRNSSQQYDVLTYNVTNITDASLYTSKSKKFYMDVYTNAPLGTEILLQLETSNATPTNYPTGRHSRYVGNITVQNQWQRIAFELLDRPDASASNTGIVRMILLFASNTFTGDTYHYDNLDSYAAQGSGGAPTYLYVSSVATSTVSAGGGAKYGIATISVRDDTGNPVANATVTGTFSGSFSETKSGVTGTNGVATIQTTGTAKGNVTVNFCVDNINHNTLPYNSSANTATCSGAGARSASAENNSFGNPVLQESNPISIEAYPNPFRKSFEIRVNLLQASRVQFSLYDMKGVEVNYIPSATLNPGTHFLKFDKEVDAPGLYLIKASVNNENFFIRQMNEQ